MQSSARKYPGTRRWSVPDVVGLGGAVAGFLAGAVMVLISPILSLLTGISVWEPPKIIAATVYGPSVMSTPGFEVGPVLTGTIIHFAISIVLGAIFGIVTHRMLHMTTDFGLPALIGLIYGLIIFFIAYFIIPLVNPVVTDYGMAPVIAQNIAFGICLGIFYSLVRHHPYTTHE
ncbi:MAG TPA: hypothetical protein VFZ66_13150 [Herpetosiphonaceae bacterium]